MGGYLPESQYNAKTQEIIDDVYPRTLQWCSTDPRPENLTSLDISKCYPSILIYNKHPIPLYTIHDNIQPFSERDLTHNYGEYYIDEYVFDRLGKGIKIEAGFYSRHLIRELIDKFKMPTNYVKWFIQSRKTLARISPRYIQECFINNLQAVSRIPSQVISKFLHRRTV